MNRGSPPPPKRLVRRQAGVFEPSPVNEFDESVRPTSPRHRWHGVDHDLIAVFQSVHCEENGSLLCGALTRHVRQAHYLGGGSFSRAKAGPCEMTSHGVGFVAFCAGANVLENSPLRRNRCLRPLTLAG